MKIPLILVFLVAIVTACGPIPPAGFGGSPSPEPTPTEPPATVDKARRVEAALISQLAGNLGLEPAGVSVISNVPAEFSDACLGVTLPDVMCAQVITPGHVIVLESDGIRYEYHASEDGSRIQPASMAITWKREGGIAGFCDTLVVFRSGEVYGNRCAPATEGRMGSIASMLAPAESERFAAWVRQLGQVQIDASDPKGVSDRMVIVLSFEGIGSRKTVSAAEEQALLEFAWSLHRKLIDEATPQ